jgi:hypothetical protein
MFFMMTKHHKKFSGFKSTQISSEFEFKIRSWALTNRKKYFFFDEGAQMMHNPT